MNISMPCRQCDVITSYVTVGNQFSVRLQRHVPSCVFLVYLLCVFCVFMNFKVSSEIVIYLHIFLCSFSCCRFICIFFVLFFML
jgi:hypothetical protein